MDCVVNLNKTRDKKFNGYNLCPRNCVFHGIQENSLHRINFHDKNAIDINMY